MPEHQTLLFARLALERGYCTPEVIQAALRELNDLDAKGQQIQLGQILVKHRHLTSQQFVEIVEALDEQILRCPDCQTTHHVLEFEEGQVYECKRCGTELRPHSRIENAVLDTRIESLRAPLGDSDTHLYAKAEPGAPADAPARRRIGDYAVLEQVGRGGMGIVYRARKDGEDREFAIKVLVGGGAEDSERVQRFLREGRIVAQLEHENIIRTYEWGQDAEIYYFAMEYVQGTTLDKYVERHPLGQRRALQVIETVARAAHHAHQHGVIHRDLKPGNVLVGDDGVVRIMDFGLARVIGDDDHSLTRSGQPMGTPYYMSPEQCRGERRKIDHRTDVYSLGAMLYELLAGRRPFSGRSTIDLYNKIQNEDPTPLRQHNAGIAKAVEDICAKAMAKSLELRYQTAEALAEDLHRVLAGHAINPSTKTGIWRIRRKKRNKALAAGVVAAAVLAASLGIWAVAFRAGRSDKASVPVAAWTAHEDSAEAAIRDERFDDAAVAIGEMASAGAPAADVERVRELARLGLGQRFTDLVFADELGFASARLGQAPAFETPPEAIQQLRQVAIDKACERIRSRLERQEYRDTEKLIAAVRDAFGDDRRLVEYERWAAGLCTLVVSTEPPGARVLVQKFDRENYQRVGSPTEAGTTPIEAAVKFGDYGLRIETEGRALDFPVALVRGEGGRPTRAEFSVDLARIPPEMVWVPAGESWIGPPESERKVEIHAFLVDRVEVTCDEYARFVAALPSPAERRLRLPYYDVDADAIGQDRRWNGSRPPAGQGNTPVALLSSEDMNEYAFWAGKRLPTREEWEKAARGIDHRPFPWGLRPDSVQFAHLDSSGAKGPLPVGTLTRGASPYGCLDLVGNVLELTSSTTSDAKRVVKGGSWESSAQSSRAWDEGLVGEGVSAALGFRCVRTWLDSTATADLLRLTNDPLAGVRFEAVRLLGEALPGAEIGQVLLPLALDDAEEPVRRAAAVALLRHGDGPIVNEILGAARVRRGESRQAALRAAAWATPADRLGEVLEFLSDPEEGVPDLVARALLRRHEPAAAAPLSSILADEDQPYLVRARAARLLADLGEEEGADFLRRSLAGQSQLEKYLTAHWLLDAGDPAGLMPMIEIATDPENASTFEGSLASYLSPLMREGSALPALRGGLRNALPEVREFCARYLGRARDEESFDLLFELASKDPAPKVRVAANNALDRIR